MLMTMNDLNGVWSNTYILIIQEELEKLTKIRQKNLTLQTYNFPSRPKTFKKSKKKGLVLALLFLVMKTNKISNLYVKKYFQKRC